MKRLLAKEEIQMKLSEDGKSVLASLFEENGYRHWRIYQLSNLPNAFISLDDLKCHGIDVIHMEAGGGKS